MSLKKELGLDRSAWATSAASRETELAKNLDAMTTIVQLIAEQTEDVEKAEAVYRNWRAIEYERTITSNGKLPEWKTKAAAESTPAYRGHWNTISESKAKLEELRGFKLCLEMKHNALLTLLQLSP